MANPPHRLHYAEGGGGASHGAHGRAHGRGAKSMGMGGEQAAHWMFPLRFLPPRNQALGMRGPIEPSRGQLNGGF